MPLLPLRLLRRKRLTETMPGINIFLVVGLGNIGAEYEGTRHNMGFMVLDAFAKASNAVFCSERYGDTAEVSLKGRKITLLKPSTYMNLSGNAVRYWMNRLGVTADRLLVICDDLNIPFGTLRMRKKGSDGGHNGLKNIQETIGTQDYCRIRAGIGNEFHRGGQIDFVLGKLSDEQVTAMPDICERAGKGIRDFVLAGADIAMNSLNASNPKKPEDLSHNP